MQSFGKVMLAGLALGTFVVGGITLAAQSSTASLTVSVNVAKNCTIVASPVNFGAYDPVSTNATAPLDGTGTLTVTCTKGASAIVGLDAGSNAQGTTRRTVNSTTASAFLTYELYKDSGRATVWGNDATSGLTVGAAPNRNPRNFTVYGRVASGQDASVGAYSDVVVATVNF